MREAHVPRADFYLTHHPGCRLRGRGIAVSIRVYFAQFGLQAVPAAQQAEHEDGDRDRRDHKDDQRRAPIEALLKAIEEALVRTGRRPDALVLSRGRSRPG